MRAGPNLALTRTVDSVEAVEAVLLRLERFMIKVWADKREPNTSLWPAFLEEELDNAMNDLADTEVDKKFNQGFVF